MRARHVLLLVAALLTTAATEAPAQFTTIEAEGAYTHSPSGMIFPAMVGDFRRVNIIRYDASGLDVSAGYNLGTPANPIVATVYIYPARPPASVGTAPEMAAAKTALCKKEYEVRKREIVDAHPGAQLIEERDVPAPQFGVRKPGKMAAFEFEDRLRGQQQALHSEFRLFCNVGETWTLAYRFTSPRSVDATGPIAAFMMQLPWTLPAVTQ